MNDFLIFKSFFNLYNLAKILIKLSEVIFIQNHKTDEKFLNNCNFNRAFYNFKCMWNLKKCIIERNQKKIEI